MLELYYKYPRVLRRLRSGGLGGEKDCIAAYLSENGYKHASAKVYFGLLGRFSEYLSPAARNMPTDQAVIDKFIKTLPTKAPRTLTHAVIELARRVAPERFVVPQVEPNPHQSLLDAYVDHLRHVRGIAPKTCEGCVLAALRILGWHDAYFPKQPMSHMTGKHVLALMEHLLTLSSNASTRALTASCVRMFLQFLQWSGLNDQDLTRFVPRMPSYRLAHLPPRLAWEDIRRAIDAIDVTTPVGVRNRAVLLLAVRRRTSATTSAAKRARSRIVPL